MSLYRDRAWSCARSSWGRPTGSSPSSRRGTAASGPWRRGSGAAAAASAGAWSHRPRGGAGVPGRELDVVTQVETVDAFRARASTTERLTHAVSMLEAVDSVSGARAERPPVLHAPRRAPDPLLAPVTARAPASSEASGVEGVQPILTECVACGAGRRSGRSTSARAASGAVLRLGGGLRSRPASLETSGGSWRRAPPGPRPAARARGHARGGAPGDRGDRAPSRAPPPQRRAPLTSRARCDRPRYGVSERDMPGWWAIRPLSGAACSIGRSWPTPTGWSGSSTSPSGGAWSSPPARSTAGSAPPGTTGRSACC